jgi:hypothetical protein
MILKSWKGCHEGLSMVFTAQDISQGSREDMKSSLASIYQVLCLCVSCAYLERSILFYYEQRHHYLVKVGPRQVETLEYMHHHSHYPVSGAPESQVWYCVPVVPATQEVEKGGSLEPRS